MSSFAKSKKISKLIMFVGFAAILLSGIVYGYAKIHVKADDPEIDPGEDNAFLGPDFDVSVNGPTVTITAGNISSSDVTGSTASDLEKFENSVNCPASARDVCWRVTTNRNWDNPSITSNPPRPAWAFLDEVKNKALSADDATAVQSINNVIGSYVTASFSAWQTVQWQTNQVTIKSPELTEALREYADNQNPKIDMAALPASEIAVNQANSTITIKLLNAYPDAKEESLWLKTTDFLRDSVFSQWEEAFTQYNVSHDNIVQQRTKILNSIRDYQNSILLNRTSNSNGQILSLEYPPSINLEDSSSAKDFKIKLDPTKFVIPASQSYKLKFFVKPTVKKDQQWAMTGNVTLTTESHEFPLTWWDFPNYIPNLPPELVNSPFFDKSYPQQYMFKLVLYDTDGTSTKEELSVNFDTINPSWTENTSVSSNNGVLSLTSTPSATGADGHFDISVTAKPTTPSSVAIVLYACNEASSDVMASDSSSCANSAGDAFIKKEWTTFSYSGGEVKLDYTWDTSGTSVGPHSIMAKAFAADGSINPPPEGHKDYIDGSKAAVTVNVTNSTMIDANDERGTDARFGNLLNGLFENKASDNARGSSIRSLDDIVNKVLKYSAGVIGVIAFLVILIAGILYMTAGGNEAQTTKAKNAIVYALLGIAIYVLSYGIMYNIVIIIKSLTGATSGGGGNVSILTLFGGTGQTEFTLQTAFAAAENLIKLATSIAAIIGFVMIIWASILYVTSVGDENKAETAKKTLIWSIAGTFIVSLAGYIVDFVDRFLA